MRQWGWSTEVGTLLVPLINHPFVKSSSTHNQFDWLIEPCNTCVMKETIVSEIKREHYLPTQKVLWGWEAHYFTTNTTAVLYLWSKTFSYYYNIYNLRSAIFEFTNSSCHQQLIFNWIYNIYYHHLKDQDFTVPLALSDTTKIDNHYR